MIAAEVRKGTNMCEVRARAPANDIKLCGERSEPAATVGLQRSVVPDDRALSQGNCEAHNSHCTLQKAVPRSVRMPPRKPKRDVPTLPDPAPSPRPLWPEPASRPADALRPHLHLAGGRCRSPL